MAAGSLRARAGLDREADAPAPEVLGPHADGPIKRGACGCGEAVVVARLNGERAVVLDAREVLPPSPCPLCRALRSRSLEPGAFCWRCGGTEVVGDPLPEPGVAVGPEGGARVYDGSRRVGEAVHRIHDCACVRR